MYSAPSLYTWRWRKKRKLLLQEMFLWFISSLPPSWGSEWFLSSQLLCLWSKCRRQWVLAAPAFLAESKAFLLGTIGRTCGSMGFAQANVAWQWKGLQRLKGPSSLGYWGSVAIPPVETNPLPSLCFFALCFPTCIQSITPLCSHFFLPNESNAEKSLSRISHSKGSNNVSLFSPLTFSPNYKRKTCIKGERKREKL